MTVSLKEVIAGLRQGKRFLHVEVQDGGVTCKQWIRSVGEHTVRHDVSFSSGGGGSADLPIETLSNGRWEESGWEEDIM